jgi:PEP-CTERM motif
MMNRSAVVSSIALLFVYVFAAAASASVNESVYGGAYFPSAADFQTFDPHDGATPTASERTVREDGADASRLVTQTFQLDSELTVDEIDILFVRGNSGNTGRVQIFDVGDTLADDFQADYDAAVSGSFRANLVFTMPDGLDPASNDEQVLRLDLTGSDQFTLPAQTGPAGYALSLSYGNPDSDGATNREVFTWRFGDPGTGTNDDSWYLDGRLLYDDFDGASSTERRRDGLFAFNGDVVPEPASLSLLVIGLGVILMRRWA